MPNEYEILVRDSIPDFLSSMKYHLTHSNPDRVIWYWKYLSLYLYLNERNAELIQCESYVLAAAKQNEAKNLQEAQQIQAIAALRLSQAYRKMRDLDTAEVYLKQAEVNWNSFNAGDLVGPADFLRYEAELAYYRGNFDRALKICQRALDLTDQAEAQLQSQKDKPVPEPNTPRIDRTLYPLQNMEQVLRLRLPVYNLLGTIHVAMQNYPLAYNAYVQVFKITRQLPGNKVNASIASLLGLAKVYYLCSDLVRARRYYRKCIDWTNNGAWSSIRAGAYLGLANIAVRENQWETALNLAKNAARFYEAAGSYGTGRNNALELIQTIIKEKPGSGPGDDKIE